MKHRLFSNLTLTSKLAVLESFDEFKIDEKVLLKSILDSNKSSYEFRPLAEGDEFIIF